MDYILYLLIFCTGAVFGSFFTLAVYRIPLAQDITHNRSYCPNCNHKLSFLDMIPIFSYTFLGGKCRYCKQAIRPRYLLLEVLSGVVFVLFAISCKFNIFNLYFADAEVLAYLVTGFLYIAALFIIAGIDKENIKVERSVLLFGFLCVIAYMIYLYVVGIETSIYRYVIYIILFGACTIISTLYLRKKSVDSYPTDIIALLILMIMYTYEIVCIGTIIITLLAVAIQLIIKKASTRKSKCVKTDKKENSKIPIAFYLCVSNIITLIATNMYIFYR